MVQVHARIGKSLRRFRGEELPEHGCERRVQFNVVEPLKRWMFQRFCNAAVHGASYEQNPSRSGVFQ